MDIERCSHVARVHQHRRELWQECATGIDFKTKSISLTLRQADAAQFSQQLSEIGTHRRSENK